METIEEQEKACAAKNCSLPAWIESSQGFCICHASEKRDDKKVAEAVWKCAEEMLKESRYDFSGWQFPEPSHPLLFKDAQFFKASFNGATFEGLACFRGCKFEDNTHFRGVIFKGLVDFRDAVFAGWAGFERTEFYKGCTFLNTSFEEPAVFTGVQVYKADAKTGDLHKASFGKAKFGNTVNFSNAVFGDGVQFSGAAFKGEALFCGAHFGGGQSFFDDAVFRRTADFTNALFDGVVEFETTHVEYNLKLSLPSSLLSRNKTPFRMPSLGQWAYRKAKLAAEARGNYTLAGDYYFAERCAMEEASRAWITRGWKRWDKKRWLSHSVRSIMDLILGRLMCGYMERPSRVFYTSALVILIFACSYFCLQSVERPDEQTERISFAESIYFSTVTFTTLGYGDFRPKSNRGLAAFEACMGAALMASFVVSISKRYAR